MPHSEAWAKRLLAALRQDRPEALLERRRYWDPVFVGLFFDHLDGLVFEDPQEALRWAEVAPHLVRLVLETAGPEWRLAHREAEIRAHAILGGAYRAAGRPEDAEKPLQAARRIAMSEAVAPRIRADVLQRLSDLRACQNRPEEALELIDEALEVYAEGSIEERKALIRRGYSLCNLRRFPDAIACFGDAVRRIDPRESPAADRAHQAAVHNLAYVLYRSARPDDAGPALRYVRQARKLIKSQRRSVARYKLAWVEGLIWVKLGAHARAEKAFRFALKGFRALSLPWETALVALDCCELLRLFGEWEELGRLAFETYTRFRELSGNTEAIAALSLILDSVRARKGTEAAIAAARQMVEARINARMPE